MKLNELKQPRKKSITELDWSPLIGHQGQSFIGDKPEGQDREGQMAKNIFARNFMQKAIGGLDAAINSGLVDPNAVGGGAQPQTTQPQNKQPQTTQPQTTQPQTPAQIRQQKQAAAAKTAQAGMTPKAPVAPNAAPQSPEEIRKQKQAAAAQTAQAGMTAKPSAPVNPKNDQDRVDARLAAAGFSPEEIAKQRAEREARVAARSTQGAPTPKLTTKPAVDPALNPIHNPRLNPTANPTLNPTANPTAAPSAPKARGGKVAGQLSATPNAIRKRNARSIAADRNRLIGDNGNANESIYHKLNSLFEGLLNINEATMAQTVAPGGNVVGQANAQQQAAAPVASTKRSIAAYLKTWFKKYTLLDQMASDAQQQADALMAQVEATWNKDHGKAALEQLGNLAFTLKQSAEEQPAQAGAAGAVAGQNAKQTGQKLLTSLQLKDMVKKLRKRDRLSLLQYLEKTVKSPNQPVSTDEPMAAPVEEPVAEPKAAPKLTPGKGDIPFPRGKAGKIGPARAGGPTPDEQANLERRIQQAVNKK